MSLHNEIVANRTATYNNDNNRQDSLAILNLSLFTAAFSQNAKFEMVQNILFGHKATNQLITKAHWLNIK